MITVLRQKRRGSGHRLPRVGHACALTAIALAVSSCAGSDGTGPGRAQPVPQGLQAAYRYIAATGAQLAEGNAFDQSLIRRRKLLAARCMTALGVSPADEPLVRFDEQFLDQPGPVAPGFAGLDSGGIPSLYNMALLSKEGAMMAPVSTGLPPYPNNLPAAAQNAIEADYLRCQRKASASFTPLITEGVTLNQLWLREVSSVLASGPVRTDTAGFGRCVRRSGAPLFASTSPSAYSRWLDSKIYTSADTYGKPVLIRPLVATDRHWTTVFVACASSLESLMQRLQLQAQKAFLRSHYHQVRALELAARNIMGFRRAGAR
jgi:hypothetical protein